MTSCVDGEREGEMTTRKKITLFFKHGVAGRGRK